MKRRAIPPARSLADEARVQWVIAKWLAIAEDRRWCVLS